MFHLKDYYTDIYKPLQLFIQGKAKYNSIEAKQSSVHISSHPISVPLMQLIKKKANVPTRYNPRKINNFLLIQKSGVCCPKSESLI